MALLFVDGADHYGTDVSNLTDGAWAEEPGAGFLLSATNPRTGTHSFRFDDTTSIRGSLRRVFGGAKTTVGLACAMWVSNLPTSADAFEICSFRDADNDNQVTIVLQTTGTLSVFRGSSLTGTKIFTTSTPNIFAETYQHIETLVNINDSTGSVEVRVDGVTVINLTGIDTQATALTETSQCTIGNRDRSVGGDTHGTNNSYFDDVFAYDDTGSYNNTFIGDRKVATLFPNADTAQADWSVVGAANGFDTINEADPNDDTDYLEAGTPGSPSTSSEFEMTNLPTGVGAISAVVLVNRSRKTDAGTANVTASLVSSSSSVGGTDRPITTAYTYYHDTIEADPDTGAPFTSSAVDAMKIRLERTA